MLQFLLLLISAYFFTITTAYAKPYSTLEWVGCGISKKAYVADLATAFEKKTNIRINIQGGGATKGIRDVVSGEADLGGSCRYRLPEDPREAGAGFAPVAWDALVIITHKDNPVENLSLKQVQGVYTGKITNWNQLGGPDENIDLFVRKSKYSGVGRTIRKLIFANFDQQFVSSKTFPSTGPLEKSIVNTPFSLAITGISSAKLRDVKILKIEGVYPTLENLKSGNYKLYRPLYITYNASSSKIKEIRKFLRFSQSREGRDIMRKNGTLPYREAIHLVTRQIKQDLSAFQEGAIFSIETNQ